MEGSFKMKFIYKIIIFIFYFIFIGCITNKGRENRSLLTSPLPVVKPVPFEARSSRESMSPVKPRVLFVMAKNKSSSIPEEWIQKTENLLIKELERSDTYVLLRPTEVGIEEKDFLEQGSWDWKKLNIKLKEKSIPLALEWELLPLQATQSVDPVGMIRERRRKISVKVKINFMDTRKGSEIASDIGSATQKDKDILWLSKDDGKLSPEDYDKEVLEELLKVAVYNVIPKILSKTPQVSWAGRVAMIKNDRLYLNVGRQSGLQVGDILKVLDTADEVFDPDSGESIGKVPGRMKGTLEVIGYFGQDGSIAVVHSGAGFQENDSVETY